MDPVFEFQSAVKPDVLDPPVVVAVGVARAGIGIGFADDAFGDDSSGVALQGILQFFTAAPGTGGYDNGIVECQHADYVGAGFLQVAGNASEKRFWGVLLKNGFGEYF